MQHIAIQLKDEAGTIALGAALARVLTPGLTLYLHGDLGAGKTALTRALLHAAGYAGHVKSPTYTLVEPYTIALHDHMVEVMHFDLYRMLSADDFLDAGFREYFNSDNICIVEWPEKADGVLPPADLDVFLTLAGDGRKVELVAHSDQGFQCLDQLHFAPNM
ncbi:tRNA threonylcarbamoyladenosine biosynthesis protein TsaE [Actimicrobium sp. GrIS 1.19]|uniref:tRNA (adenosine(37)-N6)-threonylcarbamoyltransferase complex ATPase subunit type 1 TsaE n=1 Tax=Actimicrobium sp. GrIS 1.19 TaxID=3071708 RepID=UPI002DF98D8D|nr:tRNA threonylcarbamoyladenosine biosynthesis protein TsaE [Actimicrobium sp. GrIS 1.19]